MPDLFTYTPTYVRPSPTSPALTVGILVSRGPKKFECELLMVPRGSERWSYSWTSDATAAASRAGANVLELVRVARDAAEEFRQSLARS
jgi:hypothetical protein